MTAVVPNLVEEVLGVEMRPVDVAGIQGLRLLIGLSFLVQPVVELQHAVHPTPPPGAGVLRLRLTVHTVQQPPAEKYTNEMTINNDGRVAGRRKLTTTVGKC